jgi:hypothetical protein
MEQFNVWSDHKFWGIYQAKDVIDGDRKIICVEIMPNKNLFFVKRNNNGLYYSDELRLKGMFTKDRLIF